MKKRALIKPGRKKISPGKSGENDAFQVEALETDDMPPHFSLALADGTTITVRQNPEGLLSGLSSLSRSAYWYLTRPLCSTWNYLRGSPCTSLLVVMSKEDAQALYWSIYEGIECIIVLP